VLAFSNIMRFAVIDLGTNSVRFDIFELTESSDPRLLFREKLMIRLGQKVFETNQLDPNASRRTLQALVHFKRLTEEFHATEIHAFATSALRTAENSTKFVESVRRRTGIQIEVISGKKEAELIARGVLKNEANVSNQGTLLVDIGGGSTEISIVENHKLINSKSIDLGVARLQQLYLKSIPPLRTGNTEKDPILLLENHCSKLLEIAYPKPPLGYQLLGSSGTIKALSRILKRRNHRTRESFSVRELDELTIELSQMTQDELLNLPGLESKRTDLILAGALLLKQVAEYFGNKKIQITEYSLRDGIIDTVIESKKGQHHYDHEKTLEIMWAKLKLVRGNVAHAQKVHSFSMQIFDKLLEKEYVEEKWRFALEAATILHDIGNSVSISHHEDHSAYIVRNAGFPSVRPATIELIAQLCLYHRSGKATIKNHPYAQSEFSIKLAFERLLGILRVADSLDRGHKSAVKIQSLKLKADLLHIKAKQTGGSYLEQIKIEQKKSLFEKAFDLELRVDVE